MNQTTILYTRAALGERTGADGLKCLHPKSGTMYRAILPTGDIACEDYDRQDDGVEVYTDDGEMIAFVPYANLVALVDEEVSLAEEERSTM